MREVVVTVHRRGFELDQALVGVEMPKEGKKAGHSHGGPKGNFVGVIPVPESPVGASFDR